MQDIYPQSYLTPELPYACTVMGHNVFSNGRTFSIDEKLDQDELERVIGYMLDEGLIEGEEWVFLT